MYRPLSTLACATALWALPLAANAQAHQNGPAGAIYTCTDAKGKRHTSDRLIPECMDREQRLLNPDGSQRRIVPPSQTTAERAAQETRERQSSIERNALIDATRRDRNLLRRYPDEASHQKARATALDDVRQAVEQSEKRGKALGEERKALQAEVAAVAASQPRPLRLRQRIAANEAATDAQRTLIANQGTETARINTLFDAELVRLQKLWAGAAPGTLAEPASGASAGTPGKR